MTSKYAKEVQDILAKLGDTNNQDEEREPETSVAEPAILRELQEEEPEATFQVHHFPDALIIIKEPGKQTEARIIESIPRVEPDTTVPPAPQTIPTQPLPGDKKSEAVAYAILSFSTLMLLAIIILQIYFLLHPPIATITIIPQSQSLTLTGTLQLGRVLNPIILSQSATAQATGKGHQDARNATGTVTFYNGSNTTQIINAGTVFTGNDGVQVVTDTDAHIPAANLPQVGEATVPAHALNANAKGNIQAYDINLAITSDLTVKNLSNFTGGQDERDYTVATKTDIDTAAASLKTTITQSMQAALQSQLRTDEALVTPSCNTTISPDHRPGQEATEVKVTASETCSGIAYNTQTLESKVTQLLTPQATKTLGVGYSLLGNVQVSVKQATIHQTTVFLTYTSTGIWAYALTTQEQEHIKSLLAGKTKQHALQLLSSLPGIKRVSITWEGNSKLPKDTRYIHLVIFAGI